MGKRALARECGRHEKPLPREGIERGLVAGRDAHCLPGGRGAEGRADLRPVDGRGGRRDAGDAIDGGGGGPEMVARRHADRIQHVRAEAPRLEDRLAGGAEGREVDRAAEGGGPPALPAGPAWLHGCRVHPPVHGARGGRHGASGHERRLECRVPVRLPLGRRRLGLVAGWQDDRGRRPRGEGRRSSVSRLADLCGGPGDPGAAPAHEVRRPVEQPGVLAGRAAHCLLGRRQGRADVPSGRRLSDQRGRRQPAYDLGATSTAIPTTCAGRRTTAGSISRWTTAARETSTSPRPLAASARSRRAPTS